MNKKLTDESINLSIEVLELFSLGLKPSHKDLIAGLDSAVTGLHELQIARQRIADYHRVLNNLAAVARRYLPDYDEHPDIQAADELLESAASIGKEE